MSEQAQGAGARVNTGGNAFPSPDWNGDWKGPDASHGMTLRDHFAGLALSGILGSDHVWEHIRRYTEIAPNDKAKRLGAARAAYAYADAMIAARGH
jgi:hypothetical protein